MGKTQLLKLVYAGSLMPVKGEVYSVLVSGYMMAMPACYGTRKI